MSIQLKPHQLYINKLVTEFLVDPYTTRGQVYSPTGSGKTECFIQTINDLPNIFPNKKLNICIIHPRIALSNDQLKRFKQVFSSVFRYTSFHSGPHFRGEEVYQEVSTTDPEKLKYYIEQDNRSHITFCLYDSLAKIADMEFDLLIADEAHNLTKPDFSLNLDLMKAKKVLFYTATPINNRLLDDDCKGMNNLERFGKIIAEVEPKELIQQGLVVAPLIHLFRGDTDKKGEDVNPLDVIAECFSYQQQQMLKYNNNIVQMLVVSRGLEDHNYVEERLQQLWEKLGDNIPVYTVEGNSNGVRKNGIRFRNNNRAALLEEIKQSNKSCIIMHYDTLAEGIDVNTISGACVMRQLSKYKLLQTIGRCGRPLKTDMNENYDVISMKGRKKPVSIITLPIIDSNWISGIYAKEVCDAFIAGGYGELSDFLTEEEQHKMAKKDNVLVLPDDVGNDMFLSNVINSKIECHVDKLKELGLEF